MGLFSNLFGPASTVLVVDVEALNESLGIKGNVAPRNQLQTLRRLSRFARREKLDVVAVVAGSPLNKAPTGKKFEGIQVLYCADSKDLPAFLAKTTRAKGSGAILVSGNAAAEKLLGTNVSKLRMSTFRKAFDLGGDQEPQEQRNNNAQRANRPPRRNRQRSQQQQQQQQNNEPRKERQERKPKEPSQSDAINELIDLVD
ncbi:MAG: hypothetical protein JXR40_02655 [Pontiellaceae bacterium]|nr:hypothetical protein [Pontiellaceae bacterium]